MPGSSLSMTRSFDVCVGFGVAQVVVGVAGELDLATGPQLDCVLSVVADQTGADIILDLADLEFVDAAGLRVIAALSARLRRAGRRLTLRSVPSMTLRVLAATGMSQLFDIEPPDPRAAPLGPVQRAGDRSAIVDGRRPGRVDMTVVAAVPASDDVVDAALGLVVTLARTTVGGADGASVSLNRGGRLTSVAATDETISQMDRDQYATEQGPCVAAATEGRWFHVESLAAEVRWPEFVSRAIKGGIGSILSTPLLVGAGSVGALNIYSATERAFGIPEQELAAMFATQASGILADAGLDDTTKELARRLQGALFVREVIAQAQGVLMERTGMSAEEAAGALRRSAVDAPGSVRQSAVDLVASTRRQTPARTTIATEG